MKSPAIETMLYKREKHGGGIWHKSDNISLQKTDHQKRMNKYVQDPRTMVDWDFWDRVCQRGENTTKSTETD